MSDRIYDPNPFPSSKHGLSFAQVKEWRQKEHDAGRPSSIEDFYRAHGLCVDCHSAGRFIVGLRWSDSDNIEHSMILKGSGESIGSMYLSKLKDMPEWNYTYAECEVCNGTGKNIQASNE